jgi:hypothetical protein
MAANESKPATPLETFFSELKSIAIEAFYLSAAGRQSLGYKGNTAVVNFRGCTHPEHQS